MKTLLKCRFGQGDFDVKICKKYFNGGGHIKLQEENPMMT